MISELVPDPCTTVTGPVTPATQVIHELKLPRGQNRTILLGAPTTFDATPAWHTVVSLNTGALTTALTSDPQSWSDALWMFQCNGNSRPVVLTVYSPRKPTPTGSGYSFTELREVDAPNCNILQGPLTDAKLWNVLPQLSIAPLYDPSNINSVRVVYPSVKQTDTGNYQTANVLDLAFKWNDKPFPLNIDATLLRQTSIDASAQGYHVLWPDLVWPEGFESDVSRRYEQYLSWVEVKDSGNGQSVNQRTQLRFWKPLAQLWFGPTKVGDSTLDGSKLMLLKKGKIPDPINDPRFFGDYKYGTFIDETRDGTRFFAPWSETMPGAGTPSGKIFGAVVEQ